LPAFVALRTYWIRSPPLAITVVAAFC
jgi:hypothetical protein